MYYLNISTYMKLPLQPKLAVQRKLTDKVTPRCLFLLIANSNTQRKQIVISMNKDLRAL